MTRFKTIVGFLILFVCIFSLNGCSRNNNTQLVKDFYNQLNHSNYSELSEFIGDSITITEGDYNMNYSKNDYYQFFQWDSVFNPKYEILAIKEMDNNVEISISKTCTRIKFLNQKPLVSTEVIEIKNQKISKIKNIEMDSDFKLWDTKRSQMVNWIKKNHPELDGFIYDQTKIGAQNYLKAIDFYEQSNK